jgi:hypothetical protein
MLVLVTGQPVSIRDAFVYVNSKDSIIGLPRYNCKFV